MIIKSAKGISYPDELLLLLKESAMILMGETRNLIISLCFPVAAAIVTIWIAGKDMFVNMESTKSACFILVCAAIWGGLFNSIQVVVKERAMIKRDYVSGALRISCYTISRSVVQLALCFVQSLILFLSIQGVHLVYGNDLPKEGVIFSGPMVEYFITIFLVMYAADAMGLMVSCLVKSEQLASQLSPYILIVQLLFSGVLFEMKGASSSVSALMLSRWGMEALGNISDLNSIKSQIAAQIPQYVTPVDEAFEHTPEHLWTTWLILVLFCVVPLVAGNFLLHRVKKDTRE